MCDVTSNKLGNVHVLSRAPKVPGGICHMPPISNKHPHFSEGSTLLCAAMCVLLFHLLAKPFLQHSSFQGAFLPGL